MKRFILLFSLLALLGARCLPAITVVAHEPGFTTSLARHLQRWLKEEGVAAALVTPDRMSAALQSEKLAFLVGFDKPNANELDILKKYCQRGGKLVVFHSSSPQLGALMGVKPLGYRNAAYPGELSRMKFNAMLFSGCPAEIWQTSTVLQRAQPIKGRGQVLATWEDRHGKSNGEPAWIQTDRGWWMTHVLLADGDEDLKARLVAAMCGAVDASTWNFMKHAARKRAESDKIRAFAQAQAPRQGEIRAVWEHSSCGLYPGNWQKTIQLLKESNVTDLFVNVAGAGFAHYPSAILPQSKICQQEGDQFAACLRAAKNSGIRIHAWILCFTATRASRKTLDEYAKHGWRLRDKNGNLTEYLDPSNPQVRTLVLNTISELQRNYPELAGIHLDFLRWYEGAKAEKSEDVITSFVSDARRAIHRPRLFTAAVFGKYPACVASVGQNWSRWLDANLVDFVVPMDYTENEQNFESFVISHSFKPHHAARTIVGIGVTANESRLNAMQVIRQMLITRKYGLAGTALFDLDLILEKNILPYLRLGIWRNNKRNNAK